MLGMTWLGGVPGVLLSINELDSLKHLLEMFVPAQSAPRCCRTAHQLEGHGQGRRPGQTAAGLGGA